MMTNIEYYAMMLDRAKTHNARIYYLKMLGFLRETKNG